MQTESIDQLNSLLAGEISATETYKQAINKVDDAEFRQVLSGCLECHEGRTRTLTEEVTKLGGQPVQGSGVWGAFAKMMEGGATLLGNKAAISLLEEGEDKGLDDYKKALEKNDPLVSRLITSDLLPAQERTHAAMRTLKQTA